MKISIFLLFLLPLFLAGSEFKSGRVTKVQNLQSQDPVERRGAFRALLDNPQTAAQSAKYLNDHDPQIRYAAYNYLCSQNGKLHHLKQALTDNSAQIRMFSLRRLKEYTSQPEVMKLIEKLAVEDPDNSIRQYAVELTWPFNRENKLLRDDSSWDYEVVSVKNFTIPDTRWLFTTDTGKNGHRKNYYKTDFNDKNWKPIKVGHWETQGWPDFDGIAWYRIRFDMPEKIESNAVELHFESVDESAWVWLNGIYIGKHDIGPEGWNVPFRLDVTREIKWGAENILTVRVLDRANAGGIWKPINVDILK